jgi:hypothetical protein
LTHHQVLVSGDSRRVVGREMIVGWFFFSSLVLVAERYPIKMMWQRRTSHVGWKGPSAHGWHVRVVDGTIEICVHIRRWRREEIGGRDVR